MKKRLVAHHLVLALFLSLLGSGAAFAHPESLAHTFSGGFLGGWQHALTNADHLLTMVLGLSLVWFGWNRKSVIMRWSGALTFCFGLTSFLV